jgi:hypothetical protein
MNSFTAKIYKIGVNPYVLLPSAVLKSIFEQANKNAGPIPVKGKIDNHLFIQTLVKYNGKWRLYLNGPMRKAAGKDVGDTVSIELSYDPTKRIIPVHSKLELALKKNKKANAVFVELPPSRQKEIIRYISFLKTEASVDRNVAKAMNFLLGKERFIGRDKP